MAGGDWLFWGVGVFTALLTAFYMFRMVMKTFFGAPRTEAAKNAHESSLAMIVPIGILAVLSTITGWAVLKFETFADFLAPSVSTPGYLRRSTMRAWNRRWASGRWSPSCWSLSTASSATGRRKNNELMTPQVRANHRFLQRRLVQLGDC